MFNLLMVPYIVLQTLTQYKKATNPRLFLFGGE